MIADHIYGKYDVFKRFKTVGTRHRSGFDCCFAAIRCRTDCTAPQPPPPSALSSVLRAGGKRFDLNNRFKGEVTPEEQAIAQTILSCSRYLQHSISSRRRNGWFEQLCVV